MLLAAICAVAIKILSVFIYQVDLEDCKDKWIKSINDNIVCLTATIPGWKNNDIGK